ncbi:MAG: hypothetical protein IKU69_05605, partial [Roseburia sp.]|nr:hypothetical protein [Roseburia sp.]
IPSFDFNALYSYPLSWLEITILNNYCNLYRRHTPSKGILYFYKVLEYCDSSALDILALKRFFAVTVNNLIGALYSQKRFSELTELDTYFTSPAVKCSLHLYSTILANYAQALGETLQLTSSSLALYYAYYNLLITNDSKNANLFKTFIYNDFGINLI